jgi:TATA-box binding protein (TBP) (component of TFIID and TFIIIB)
MLKQNFKDIAISTRTIIVATNTMINIETLYENLPITEYTVIRKKRGRKKKDMIEDINNMVPSGSIISIKYKDQLRGVELKRKKKETKFFRNAVTIIMSIDNKFINLKVSTNGKFQVTGCKHFEHCKKAITNIFNIIIDKIDIYLDKHEDKIEILFNNVMTNKDFSMGFQVNREVLDNIINSETPYNSLLETSFGYTGINLKMVLNPDIERSFKCISINIETKEATEYILSYKEYISKLTEKEITKEKKKRHITFLIFQSGNVIMSGINEILMEYYYNEFYKIIEKNYDNILMKLLTV